MKNMGNAKSIFVIDDDVNIGNMLEEALIKEGAQKAQYTVLEKITHEFNVDGGEFSPPPLPEATPST